KARQIIAFEDAESHQGDDALSVGRHLDNGVSAIISAERVDPLGLGSIEVLAVEETAVLVQDVEDAVPDVSGVKRAAAVLPNRSPGPRQVLLTENLSRLRRLASRQVRRRVGGEKRELRGAPFPSMADLRPHGETFLGVSRGGFDEIAEVHRAETLVQRKIAVERARDRDGRRPGLRHGRKAGGAKVVEGEARPRAAAAVEAETFAVPVREDHTVAAEPVHHRLSHVDHRSHGDRRVGGVAARLENVPADRRRKRLTRTGHPGFGEDRRSLRIEWSHGPSPLCALTLLPWAAYFVMNTSSCGNFSKEDSSWEPRSVMRTRQIQNIVLFSLSAVKEPAGENSPVAKRSPARWRRSWAQEAKGRPFKLRLALACSASLRFSPNFSQPRSRSALSARSVSRSAGKDISIRSSCNATSCGVPNVVIVLK